VRLAAHRAESGKQAKQAMKSGWEEWRVRQTFLCLRLFLRLLFSAGLLLSGTLFCEYPLLFGSCARPFFTCELFLESMSANVAMGLGVSWN